MKVLTRVRLHITRTTPSIPKLFAPGRVGTGCHSVPREDGGHDYELDFDKCKPGVMCISRCYDETAECDFVEVGEVKSIASKDDKTFTVVKYLPVGEEADTHDEACLSYKWTKQKDEEEMHNWSQIQYFKKLNSNGKLPKTVIKAVKERALKWRVTDDDDM